MSEQEIQIQTVNGLRPMIERAIKEVAELQRQSDHLLMADTLSLLSRQLSDHISKTVIGELFELELVRKMRPMVREHGALMRLIGSVSHDFLTLEESDENVKSLMELRTPSPKEPLPLL